MAAILEIKTGPMAGKSVAAKTGQTVSVGRAEGRANFAVPHDTFMSSVHFAIECGPHGCRVADRRSSNGTYLNDAKIAEAMLANGDEIRSGQTVFKVRLVADDKLPTNQPVAPPPVRSREEGQAARFPKSRPDSGVLETSRETQPKRAQAPQPVAPTATPEKQPIGPAPSPTPVLKQRAVPLTKPPVLTVGSWTFSVVPNGWKIKEEFGVERDEQDAFPSSVVASEEMIGSGTLQQFMDVQISMLRKYLRDPTIEAGIPPAIAGAEETVSIDVRYKTKDGRPVVYLRVYARSGTTVGTMTLTTLEPDLEQIRPAYEAILSGVTFQRNRIN